MKDFISNNCMLSLVFLLQNRAENLPVPEFKADTSDDIDLPLQQNQSSLRATLRTTHLKCFKPAAFTKPNLQEIRSATILKEERRRTLAPFELFGTFHVGQDNADLLREDSAWGGCSQSETDEKHEEKMAELQVKSQHKESCMEELDEKEKVAATKLSTSTTHHRLQALSLVDLTKEKAKGEWDVGGRGREGIFKSDNLWSSYYLVYRIPVNMF